MKGKILWWNGMQSRGFIISEAGEQVYFTGPASEKDADLNSGDKVTYDLGTGPEGPQAVNVVRVQVLEAKAGGQVDVGGGFAIHVDEQNAKRSQDTGDPKKKRR